MRYKASHEKTSRDRARSEGFTLVELLVVIAIIGTLAAMLSPTIITALKKGDEATCTNNLKNIGQSAIAYALDKRFFPVAKGKNPPAYESLNVLLDSNAGSILSPDIFICPASTDEAAEKDSDGAFVLDEYSNSYAWLGKKTKAATGTGTILGCDDSIVDKENDIEENHDKFLIVVYSDGSVKKLEQSDMDEGARLPKNLVGQESGG
ncbi:MAG TPA: type II secretion system protein [Planctomycetes bacterium]|nr:type II secretion system protein [Planctomycetota bacterium]